MTVHVERVCPDFVAKIKGLDLGARLDRSEIAALRRAGQMFGVLILPGQELDYQQMLEFAGLFGKPSACEHISNLDDGDKILDPESFEGRQTRGNMLWHMDMLVLERPPQAAALLAQELPSEGGETQFADLAAAWKALPPGLRTRLASCIAVHDIETIRRRMGFVDPEEIRSEYAPFAHPLVCSDPLTGREAPLFGAHTSRLEGMSADESDLLLTQLLEHVTREEFVHTHEWRQGDLVMWNNRVVMHRVLPYEHTWRRRMLWRVEILSDERPSRRRSVLRRLSQTLFRPAGLSGLVNRLQRGPGC